MINAILKIILGILVLAIIVGIAKFISLFPLVLLVPLGAISAYLIGDIWWDIIKSVRHD